MKEPKTQKIRLHFDIRVSTEAPPADRWPTIKQKVAELVAAGGRVVREDPEHHIVMADPEGNEFCVC